MNERIFTGKTVNFLLASKVIGGHFLDNISELKEVNTFWTPAYATEFNNRVDSLAAEYLGISIRNSLFKSSVDLTLALKFVKDDLVTIRKNVFVDFRKSPEFTSIISDLGLDISNVHTLTQGEIIEVLSRFKRGLTPAYLAKITAGGMPTALPNRIAASADTIINLNNEQEKLKNSVKEATGKMVDELNVLYCDVIKICKLASNFYKRNPAKKSMFSFTSIMKNLGEGKTATKKEKKQAAA